MATNHSPVQIVCLLVNFLAAVLTTLVVFTNLARQYGFQEAVPGLLRNDLQKVATMQPSPISPPSWIHCVWGVILLWQVAWSTYGLVSVFRTIYGFPLYTNPVLLSPLMLLLFTFGCGFNIAWFILYDRVYTSTSCLFIFLMTVTIWAAHGTSVYVLNWNFYRLEKSLMYSEIYTIRALVQNGLAAYGMWGVFVLAFNVVVALLHNENTQLAKDVATVAGLAVIGFAQVIYFLCDVTCLDRFTRYVATPYLLPILVLSACLFRQDTWYSTDLSFILLSSLLAFALVALMLKSAWVAFRVIRNRTGGCVITHAGPTPQVDEAYYLLK